MRITKARPTECSECNGLGYTDATCDIMEVRRDREYGTVEKKTVSKGSGCPRCLGTGQSVAAAKAAKSNGALHTRRVL